MIDLHLGTEWYNHATQIVVFCIGFYYTIKLGIVWTVKLIDFLKGG